MLENYAKNEDGIIYQVNREPFKYDEFYLKHYKNMGSLLQPTSMLRLGYIIGSIGKIPTSLLDVGYGNAAFLNSSRPLIPKLYGNDVARQLLPDGVEYVEDIMEEKYDVITFFDSLEHMEDIEFVKDLKCNYICVSLPWCHYFNDEWFESWKHRKPDEHLWHFNKGSLEKFMTRMGYETIDICNLEDATRDNGEKYENILTGIFKKIK
jgi:hypothetical protein